MSGEWKFTTLKQTFFCYRVYADDEFVQENSPWEQAFSTRYGVDMKVYRENVLKDLNFLFPDSVLKRQHTMWRWKKALFDSVGEFFCIGRFFRVVGVPLPKDKLHCWFGDTLCAMDECDVVGTYNGGREDLDIDEGDNSFFHLDSIAAVREKLDGIRFVRRDESDGSFMCGAGVRFPIVDDIELAEWVGDKFFSLYPIGLPTFTTKEGVVYHAHNYLHPGEFIESTGNRFLKIEGMMLLMKEGSRYVEKRVKHKPSIELENYGNMSGVWEFELSVYTGTFSPVRPRPGKKFSWLATFNTIASISQLPITSIPQYDIRTIHLGPYEGNFQRRGDGSLSIDSGFRTMGSRLCHINEDPRPVLEGEIDAGDVLWYMSNLPPVCVPIMHPVRTSMPPRIITSVKALVYDPSDKTFVTLKEHDSRSYGLPGGRIELGESAANALDRELKEELGVTGVDVAFVGSHKSEEGGTVYYSMMYVLIMNKIQINSPFPVKYLPWCDPPLDGHEHYFPSQLNYLAHVFSDPLEFYGYSGRDRRATLDGDLVTIATRPCADNIALASKVLQLEHGSLHNFCWKIGVTPYTLLPFLFKQPWAIIKFPKTIIPGSEVNLVGPGRGVVKFRLPEKGEGELVPVDGMVVWDGGWVTNSPNFILEQQVLALLREHNWRTFSQLNIALAGALTPEFMTSRVGRLWKKEPAKKTRYKSLYKV